MKLLIPSAKELNEQARIVEPQPLSENTKTILQALKQFSLEELATFYGISEERAQVEKERIEALLAGSAKTYPALELFDGLMYRASRLIRKRAGLSAGAFVDHDCFIRCATCL